MNNDMYSPEAQENIDQAFKAFNDFGREDWELILRAVQDKHEDVCKNSQPVLIDTQEPLWRDLVARCLQMVKHCKSHHAFVAATDGTDLRHLRRCFICRGEGCSACTYRVGS
jgi:hypothetical protein